ncbi:MAG: hypothetical protein BWY06_02402 [Candidatus Latescibacteria bacterium ADurb.Bin168]|nr:MAG: hypothetical protein BWY06_02402 [Candidatus Latescibacteria bacterium ADurb.Bin168]
MFDRELVSAVLGQISETLDVILARTRHMKSSREFTETPEGKERLDGICMLFIALGESLKNLDKITRGELLSRYPEIDWTGVKGFRDIIAHHYFDIDAETVYWMCRNEVPRLNSVVRAMREATRTGEG